MEMEATGSRPWSYSYLGSSGYSPYSIRSSSSSGTIASTGYTFTGSHISSVSSVDAAMDMPLALCKISFEYDYNVFPDPDLEQLEKRRIKILVQEFFAAPSQRESESVLDTWLTELGVSWVLHLADDAALDHRLHPQSWIRALGKITETIRLASLFPDPGTVVAAAMPSIREEAEDSIPDKFQFANFFQKTMSKMIAFVDAIVAPNALEQVAFMNQGLLQLHAVKLSALLGVRHALSRALAKIWYPFLLPPSAEAERVQDEIVSLLSVAESKVAEAIWNVLGDATTCLLKSIEDGDGFLSRFTTPEESSDIHQATKSVMGYISFLMSNYSSLAALNKYVPQTGTMRPLDSMVMQMASCLQEKLANISDSFPDQGLKFLFLLNNSDFIMNKLHYKTDTFLHLHVEAIFGNLKCSMDSYLQVSWAPVLSSLFDSTPQCFVRNGSPLYKFESAFQKTYKNQKQWKVPDPELRKRLREAIIGKIIPSYTKYIEDNQVVNPNFSPQELEEMLQELFEG